MELQIGPLPKNKKKSNWKPIVFIITMFCVSILLLFANLNRYVIIYDTYTFENHKDTVPYWNIDFINNMAVEYSLYDSIDPVDIAEWNYLTKFEDPCDSLRIIGVFKNNHLIYSQKAIRE